MRQALARNLDNVEYIHAMLCQLHTIAARDRMEMLAFLIEMACMEASDTLKSRRSSALDADKTDGAA